MSNNTISEKRRFSRIAFDAPVVIHRGQQSWQSELMDISLKGVLVKLPSELHGVIGEIFKLEIELQGTSIEMETSLVHIESDSVGFLCESIDLDSIQRLKRLIELNLADEQQLQREIGEILGQQALTA